MFTQIPPKLGPRPIGYLTNAAGKRTHAIIPLVADDWDSLLEVEPDTDDLAFLARFNKNPDAFLEPAPNMYPGGTACSLRSLRPPRTPHLLVWEPAHEVYHEPHSGGAVESQNQSGRFG